MSYVNMATAKISKNKVQRRKLEEVDPNCKKVNVTDTVKNIFLISLLLEARADIQKYFCSSLVQTSLRTFWFLLTFSYIFSEKFYHLRGNKDNASQPS